ncbi:MAG: GntR family transcriptional regulator [Marinilabilia sp.]
MNTIKQLPPHKKVYETLRKHINERTYKEGDLLPSENELCIIHDVTRPTIRKALDRLLHEGYIKKKQGKGSIVMGQPKGIGILSLSGTTSAVGKENLLTKIIVKPQIRNWSSAFSFPLHPIEKEVGCIYFERLRLMDGQSVFYDITMIPNINLPRFTSRSLENKSLFDILRINYQINVIGGEQRIMATTSNQKIQEVFGVPQGHPVLQLDRKIETNKENFFIYSQVFCDTTDYALYGTF